METREDGKDVSDALQLKSVYDLRMESSQSSIFQVETRLEVQTAHYDSLLINT
jgi:hypothetical protein